MNVRAGPGGTFEVLAQLSKRERVQILSVQGEWFAVPLPEPVSAYIHSSYLEIQAEQGRVRGDRVRVRAGPGLSSASFGLLSAGETVRVRSVKADWVEIQPPGFCRGWVHRSFVTILEEP